MNNLSLSIVLLMCAATSAAQETAPVAFQTGDYELSYEQIVVDHATMLLTVCDNDMEIAYDRWTKVLHMVEQQAIAEGLDINGVKLWLNFFWDSEGHVDHVTFFPKPNSKNIDFQELLDLLTKAAPLLTIPVDEPSRPFSHYGSVSFPIYHHHHSTKGN